MRTFPNKSAKIIKMTLYYSTSGYSSATLSTISKNIGLSLSELSIIVFEYSDGKIQDEFSLQFNNDGGYVMKFKEFKLTNVKHYTEWGSI